METSNLNNPYTVDFFIKKFEAIPEDKWICNLFVDDDGRRCAQGFCGMDIHNCDLVWEAKSAIVLPKQLHEGFYLVRLFNDHLGDDYVAKVNNGCPDSEYKQSTPKQRILAALHDIKKLQEPKVKEVIRYVAVSESLKKQTKELIEN